MNHKRNLLHETVQAFIPFLHYAELHADDLRALGVADLGVARAFLSPDVNSLHLVWTEVDSSVILHQVVDYPYNLSETITDLLSKEIGGDSYDLYDDEPDVFALLSDYGNRYAEDNPPPVIRLADLQDKERELTPEFQDIEKFVGLMNWIDEGWQRR